MATMTYEMACLLGACLEMVLFGGYSALFFSFVPIMIKKMKVYPRSALIFMWAIIFMYCVCTIHVGFGVYRLAQRFVFLEGTEEGAVYFLAFMRWEIVVYNWTANSIVWLCEVLLIYRCFIIWGCSWLVIVVPTLLFVCAFCMSLALNITWLREGITDDPALMHIAKALVPLTFTLHVLTMALICIPLIKTDRALRASGIRSTRSRLSLITVVRIMVESAAPLTAEMLLCIVLNTINHPAVFIGYGSISPTIGIVFTLIAIRVHNATLKPAVQGTSQLTTVQWVASDQSRSADDQGDHDLELNVGVKSSRSVTDHR